mmetsp:Transcript_17991/g.34794  ORF Transcript_17991/g.34794 Transcript_17991/m.34794 type:complete len:346 (-) Transcript_17991:119-1156(-)
MGNAQRKTTGARDAVAEPVAHRGFWEISKPDRKGTRRKRCPSQTSSTKKSPHMLVCNRCGNHDPEEDPADACSYCKMDNLMRESDLPIILRKLLKQCEVFLASLKSNQVKHPEISMGEAKIGTRRGSSKKKGSTNPTVYFLMLGGSFNPVHTQHIAALEMARNRLEEEGKVVVGGFLGVSSKFHVVAKLGEAMTITKQHRSAMCQEVTNVSDWIETVPWGWANAQRQARLLEAAAQRHLPDLTVRHYTVLGADHPVVFPGAVMAMRKPHSQAIKALLESRPGGPPKDFFMTREELENVSSTKIRELVHAHDWEGLKKTGWVHPRVLTYMKKHDKQLWMASDSTSE